MKHMGNIFFYFVLISSMILSCVSVFSFPSTYIGAGNDRAQSHVQYDFLSQGFSVNGTYSTTNLLGSSNTPLITNGTVINVHEIPVACQIDRRTSDKYIIYPTNNSLYVYSPAGDLLFVQAWSTPKSDITCHDVDNDGTDDIVGIRSVSGTNSFDVYGYDASSNSLQIKSQNDLLSVSINAPYSSITCTDTLITGEDSCYFTSQDKFVVMHYDSSAGNFFVSQTVSQSTSRKQSDPVMITDSAIVNNPAYAALMETAADHTLYFYVIDNNGTEVAQSTFLLNAQLEQVVYASNFHFSSGSVTQSGSTYGNVTLVGGATGASQDYAIFQLRLAPGNVSFIPNTITVSNAVVNDTTERRKMFALFDYDGDNKQDLVLSHQGGGAADRYAEYNMFTYLPSSLRFSTSPALSAPFDHHANGVNSFTVTEAYTNQIAVTDTNNDGVLDLVMSEYQVTNGNELFNTPVCGACTQNANDRGHVLYMTTSLPAQILSFNITQYSATLVNYFDINDDSSYDLLMGSQLVFSNLATPPNSHPSFSIQENSTRAANQKCSDTQHCSTVVNSTIQYFTVFFDQQSDPVYFAYDCDLRFEPGPSSLIQVNVSPSVFTCNYQNLGNTLTRVWVNDVPDYTRSKDVNITITYANGQLCNYNGVPEPNLGETPDNCAPDFPSNQTTPEQAQANATATANAAQRDTLLAQNGFSNGNIASLSLNADGTINEAGTLADLKNTLYTIFGFIVLLLPEILTVVIIIALILYFSKRN